MKWTTSGPPPAARACGTIASRIQRTKSARVDVRKLVMMARVPFPGSCCTSIAARVSLQGGRRPRKQSPAVMEIAALQLRTPRLSRFQPVRSPRGERRGRSQSRTRANATPLSLRDVLAADPIFRRHRLRLGTVFGQPVGLRRGRRAVAHRRIGQARPRRLGLERADLIADADAEEVLHAPEQAAGIAELGRLV